MPQLWINQFVSCVVFCSFPQIGHQHHLKHRKYLQLNCLTVPVAFSKKQPEDGCTNPKFLKQCQDCHEKGQDGHDSATLHHRRSWGQMRRNWVPVVVYLGTMTHHDSPWPKAAAKGLKTSCLTCANLTSMSLTMLASPPWCRKWGSTRKDLATTTGVFQQHHHDNPSESTMHFFSGEDLINQ